MFTSWSLDIILFKAGREKYGKLIFPCRTGLGKLRIFNFFISIALLLLVKSLKFVVVGGRGGGGMEGKNVELCSIIGGKLKSVVIQCQLLL